MSQLIVDTLVDDITLTHKVDLKESMTLVGGRIHIYKHGLLTDGNVVIDVVRDSVVLSSVTIPYTYFNDIMKPGTTDPAIYWHGMIPFTLPTPIVIKLDPEQLLNILEIQVTIQDHTNSDSIFLSWVKETNPGEVYITGAYPLYGDEPSEDIWYNPYTTELFTL